jgi:hypothetical protein
MKRLITSVFLLAFVLTGGAFAADTVKIGVYLPLTGQMAFGGQLELEGVQMAYKEMRQGRGGQRREAPDREGEGGGHHRHLRFLARHGRR